MPTAHGIDVFITTTEGNRFVEYGTKPFIGASKKSRTISTQIEARTGHQFYIHIRPIIPFPYEESGGKIGNNFEQANKTSTDCSGLIPHLAQNDQNLDGCSDKEINERESRKQSRRSPESKDNKNSDCIDKGNDSHLPQRPKARPRWGKARKKTHVVKHQHPPFDLSALVYIDGQDEPDIRRLVYLNPKHPRYDKNGYYLPGRTVLCDNEESDTDSAEESRTQPVQYQKIRIYNWVFSSVGIDVLLSRLDMNAVDPEIPKTAADREVNELTSMMAENTVDNSHKPKPGQIEIRIVRIVTGEVVRDKSLRRQVDANSDDRVKSTADTEPECTHTIALQKEDEESEMMTTSWDYFKENEEIYARFIFQYMGREKLVNLGLCNEDGTPIRDDRTRLVGGLKNKYAGKRRKARIGENESKELMNTEKRVRS